MDLQLFHMRWVRWLFQYNEDGLCTMSEQQKEHVLTSWLKLSEDQKQHLGEQIFLNIFARCPEIKSIFRFTTATTESNATTDDLDLELLNDRRFIEHAERFVHVLDTSVHGLHGDVDALLGPALWNLGQRHVRWRAPFSDDMIDTFILGMLVSLRNELGDLGDEAQEAWLGLMGVIVHNMKDGYDLNTLARQRNIESGSLATASPGTDVGEEEVEDMEDREEKEL